MRRILVRLAGEPTDDGNLRAAATLARWFGARLDGVFVRPRPASVLLDASPAAALTALLGGARVSDLDPEDDTREAVAREIFLAACQTAGLAVDGGAAGWRGLIGRSELVLAAVLADLLVETGVWPDPDPASDDLFHVLGDSQRPVLLPPPNGSDLDLTVAAVVWDRSLPSARALVSATPLLGKAQSVVVLHHVEAEIESVQDHLALHGLSARFEPVDLSTPHPTRAVVERALDLGAGLLAMGGYEHSHLEESLLGGFTQEMLAARRFALLLRR